MCASNSSSPGVCELYDRLPASHSSTFTMQVGAIMKSPERAFTMQYINVQMQSAVNECGLLAIAFVVTLCAGKDPHICSYDQSQMRQHLYQCLQEGKMTKFSATNKTQAVYKTSEADEVWRCTVHADCPGISQRTSLVTLLSAENSFTRSAWTSLMKLTLNLFTVGFVYSSCC